MLIGEEWTGLSLSTVGIRGNTAFAQECGYFVVVDGRMEHVSECLAVAQELAFRLPQNRPVGGAMHRRLTLKVSRGA